MPAIPTIPAICRFLNRKSVWRAIWIALLLLHAPITYRVFSLAIDGESKWSSLVLIGITNLFFVLEIVFGWSLHILTDRRRIVAFVVIIALLHVGMVDHALPGWSFMTELNAWLAVSIGGLLLVAICLPRIAAFCREWRALLLQIDLYRRRRGHHVRVLCRRESHAARFLAPVQSHRAPPF